MYACLVGSERGIRDRQKGLKAFQLGWSVSSEPGVCCSTRDVSPEIGCMSNKMRIPREKQAEMGDVFLRVATGPWLARFGLFWLLLSLIHT